MLFAIGLIISASFICWLLDPSVESLKLYGGLVGFLLLCFIVSYGLYFLI